MATYSHNITFANEIAELISLKQEGGYWDFKKKWHSDKSDLLHDIICMANNLYGRESFIIIGVDEEHDFTLVDTTTDENRKNTQMLVDFLKDKPFAGSIRPIVHVESILLGNATIDIIVVASSHNTPYFLCDRYESLRAYHIYTRVMDTNTPVDRSADLNHVEQLWKRHFYIDEPPLERFSYYLSQPDQWVSIPGSPMNLFYKAAPEFTIIREKDEDRNGYEYYLFGQINLTPSWWSVTLKYHQTAIERFTGINLDGGKCFVIAPSRGLDIRSSSVGYYIGNTLMTTLLDFFHQREAVEEYSYKSFMNGILQFNSDVEKNKFESFVNNNLQLFQELYTKNGDSGLPYFPTIPGIITELYKGDYREALVLKEMLQHFRKLKTSF